ncbi:MAG: hypothetical protein AAB779_00335 [Patescibacteria group bacterium]
MAEITARAILARVAITVMNSLPGKLTDKQALRREITQLIDSFPPLPECQLIRRTGEKLVQVSPQCWGTHRSRAWWRIVLAALPVQEAIELYIGQFPRQITGRQLASIRRYLQEVAQKRQLAGVDDKYIETQLKVFSIRPNQQRVVEEAFGIYFTH